MKKVKKLLSILMAITLLAGTLAACSSEPETETPPTGESGETEQAATDDFSEKVTLNLNVIFTEKQDIDPRYDYVKEMFNVDFDLVACSLNDVKEKTRIWVAGGDMPDIMWTDMDLNLFSELKQWAEGGVLKEFPSLESYPNLQAIKDTIPSYEYLQVDGKDYFYLGGRGLEEMNFSGPEMYIYRKDWAEQLGMYQDEYTWEEMIELAKAFSEQDPGGNGAGNTIGMAAIGWAYPVNTIVARFNPTMANFTASDDGYVWGASLPESLEGIMAAKELYDENVFWREQALAQNFDGPSKFQAGQVGILYHNLFSNNVVTTIDGFKQANPDINVNDAIGVMKIVSDEGTYPVIETTEFWGTISFSSTIEDEEMHRFLAMHDWLNSPEGLELRTYGLEGVDYNKNGDEYEILWEKDENGVYISPYEPESDRLLNMFQITEAANYSMPTLPEDAQILGQEVVEYMQSEQAEVIPLEREIRAFSAPTKDKYNLVNDYREKVIELILNSDDIESDYNSWLAEMQPTADEIIAELNEGLQ